MSTPPFCYVVLLAVNNVFVNLDLAIRFLKFLYAILSQKLKLSIQGTFVRFGNLRNLIQQFRLKSDTCLYFIGSHDNTSTTF